MENKQNGSFRFFFRLYRQWNEFRAWFASSLDADTDRKSTLYIDLSRSATLQDLVYWLQLLFSAGIATLGLVQGSTAVIIGAMLISPLMAPILSAGLALATGDLTLGVRAVANLILSSLLGLGFAFILVKLLPYTAINPEISSRTAPNTLDLVIALFSGAIGAIATCRETKGVATSIPGVAIAVALMPPLCVVGYGIGVGNWSVARGGGLLYLTNLVAITFTAMLVFVLLRIDRKAVREKVSEWRSNDNESLWWLALINRVPRLEKARQVRSFTLRLMMVLIPLVIIYIPLSQSLSKLRDEFNQAQRINEINKSAADLWADLSKEREFTELDTINVTPNGDKLTVHVRAFSNTPLSEVERVGFINQFAGLQRKKPQEIELQATLIPTAARSTGGVTAVATPTPKSFVQVSSELRQKYDSAMEGFTLPSPAERLDYTIGLNDGGRLDLIIYYLSTREIQEDGKEELQKSVRSRLNLQTLSLFLSRVSSTVTNIPFKGNTDELELESEELTTLVENLRIHKDLRVRIMIGNAGEEGELSKKRKAALSKFLFEEKSLPESRVVFTETDLEDVENTFQFYLKK